MRLLVALFFVAIAFHATAGKPVLQYSIQSDTLDLTIAEGSVVIEGIVTYYGDPLINSLIATCDSRIRAKTNAKGEYKLTITDQDSCLYMFKSQYDEIITRMYDFKSQHRVKILFYATQNRYMIEADKPILYIYNKDETDCSIKINPRGEFSFTYPAHNEKWEFVTKSDGTLKTASGEYPYLFWEGESSHLRYVKSSNELSQLSLANAYQINTDSTISFLESQLNQFGLNDRERTDFITYWGPRIQEQDYALIQFIWGEGYTEHIGSIDMTPKPESSLRLFMLMSNLDALNPKIQTTPLLVSPLKRNGLTLIEWGGSQLLPPNILAQ
jgi:hypothetical protein